MKILFYLKGNILAMTFGIFISYQKYNDVVHIKNKMIIQTYLYMCRNSLKNIKFDNYVTNF